MGEKPNPITEWGARDWFAMLVCAVIGLSVMTAVGKAVRPTQGFWPAFAAKVVAGTAAMLAALAVWAWLVRRRS